LPKGDTVLAWDPRLCAPSQAGYRGFPRSPRCRGCLARRGKRRPE
jgi:hypothetical protein